MEIDTTLLVRYHLNMSTLQQLIRKMVDDDGLWPSQMEDQLKEMGFKFYDLVVEIDYLTRKPRQ